VSAAGVSRKTFYEHFSDKEDCFLAAFDAGVEIVLAAIGSADMTESGWVERMRVRTRVYLETLASEPAFARSFLIEVFAAGPRALERRQTVHERFKQLLRDEYEETRSDYPELPEVPDAIYVAAVGAINELVSSYVREGRTGALPDLEDTLCYLQVVMFAGHETASGLIGVRPRVP
jgi:AcrR family transcriptional regulator